MKEFRGLTCSDCRVTLDVMAEPGPMVVLCRRCWFRRFRAPQPERVEYEEGASCSLGG